MHGSYCTIIYIKAKAFYEWINYWTRSLFVNIEISTTLAKYTCKSTAPGERKERYYRLVVKRKFLGREKRDINETCHITTAPEMKSRGINATCCIYLSVDSSLGEKREISTIFSIYLWVELLGREKETSKILEIIRTAPGERKEKFQWDLLC